MLRTSHNDEIDIVTNPGRQTSLVEIKASVTYKPVFHKMLDKLGMDEAFKQVIYRGDSINYIRPVFNLPADEEAFAGVFRIAGEVHL